MSQTADDSHRYQKQTIKLAPSHRWKAAPGCKILVLEAGAVRLDYPESWHVIPKNDRLNIHDRVPPADEGRFQITVFRLPKLDTGRSWNDLPLDVMLRDAMTAKPKGKHDTKEERQRKMVHDVTLVHRPDLQYAWGESIAPDPENGKMILTRQVMARARGVQPLITFDYYTWRADEYVPVWKQVIDSLRLGTPVSLLGDVVN